MERQNRTAKKSRKGKNRNSMKIRLAAWSEPAGKYDPKAPLEGNEDNMFVSPNLADRNPISIQSDVTISLGKYGCLMAVADGMGGMNAGEVASAIAIDTVKSCFAPDNISGEIASSPKGRKRYLESVIKEADKAIKKAAKEDPDKEGMGSTIILAWLADNGLTISWCGDSRAYLFNSENGLRPLSEDHSYVQELVKAHKLEYVDTFDHPQGNIITRSLGDPSKGAEPETREFSVVEGDILLLCSDGLSGVLRDRKTKDKNGEYYPGDNLEDIIRSHQESLIQCRQALFDAAEKADWYDNVTVILCQIMTGDTSSISSEDAPKSKAVSLQTLLWSCILVVILFVVCVILSYRGGVAKGILNQPDNKVTIDSLSNEITKRDSIINSLSIPPQIKEERPVRHDEQKKPNTGTDQPFISEDANTSDKTQEIVELNELTPVDSPDTTGSK